MKSITITYKDVDYTLRYTKQTTKLMEDAGFRVGDVKDKLWLLYDLFSGAFLADHRKIKKEVVDEIFEHLPNKDAFYEKLIELYQEPYEYLLDSPEEGAEGNATWGASW